MDLRLYTEVAYKTPLVVTTIQGNRTDRLETIANKVVKYILTDKGSDLVDPAYGSNISSVNTSQMERITYEVSAMLTSCTLFIKQTEQYLPKTTEKLAGIQLISIELVDARDLFIHISISTSFNNYALLDLKK